MSRRESEARVLCLPRAALPGEWLPCNGWRRLTLGEFARRAEACGPVLVPRGRAEVDAAYKQLIPYLVAVEAGSGRVALYPRQGSEARLHGLFSVGLGGHVEAGDSGGRIVPTLLACARRELAEELPGAEPLDLVFAGIINEEVTEVGRVHLGLVFRVVVAAAVAAPSGGELGSLRWVPPAEAARRPLEHWSRLALHLLREGPP